jgi:DNA-binding transcriptional LysR family regulator
MDLRQLATFQAVARTLSFTRAALELNYAQSSVTAQIQALEEELGAPLFDRLGRRVALTAPGRRLQIYAGRILALADEARAAVAADLEPSGTLTVSAVESLTTYRLPPVLRAFRQRYPKVRLLLRTLLLGDARSELAEGTLDAALILDDTDPPPGVAAEPLLREPIVVFAGPQHPLVGAASVSPMDLEDETLLLTEGGCGYRATFDRALAQVGVRPASMLEFSSVEAIKQCVMAGMGIAVLPLVAVRAEIERGELAALRWSERDFTITTQLLWNASRWQSPALAAFLATTRELLVGAPSGPLVPAST